jgi:hypothetical protein
MHVRREFMQRLTVVLYSALSSYLRDALKEENSDAVACFPVPRALDVWPGSPCSSCLVVSSFH